jgi:basic amino acid/polyamine antiporter, APA family
VTLSGFLSALVGVLFAYHGWMNLTPVAEEVKDPQRNLPLALFVGVGTVIFLYLGANWAYQQVISQEEMVQMKELSPTDLAKFRAEHGPDATLPDKTVAIGFCHRLLGPIGAAVAAAAVMFSVFGAINGNLLVGPRLLYAMGEDGLAPRALGQVHPRYNTPALAILVVAGWAALLVLGVAALTESNLLSADKPHFDRLTDFAMFGATTFETAAVATIFVFRRRYPEAQRSYRCVGYPLVPAIYVLILSMVVVNTFIGDTVTALIGLGFMGVGALIYGVSLRQPNGVAKYQVLAGEVLADQKVNDEGGEAIQPAPPREIKPGE